jgi:hypothetical protein
MNAVVFCVYLAAHLFDIFIIVPNWRSGTVEEIRLYNAFFDVTDPRNFFQFLRPISILISILCLVAYWRRGSPIRTLVIIAFLIDVGIYLFTSLYFSPINDYLFLVDQSSLDPALVSDMVSKWIASNYIRIALVTVGFYTSVRAVHFAYPSRRM